MLLSYLNKSKKWNVENDIQHVVDDLNSNKNNITTLNLSGNTLGVNAAEALTEPLSNQKAITSLFLNDLFTGRGKDEISFALKSVSLGLSKAEVHLVELDLCDNAFGPNGVVGITDLIASPCCYTLKVLNMNNQGLGHQGCRALVNSMKTARQNSDKHGLNLEVFIAGRNRLENVGMLMLSEVFGDGMNSLKKVVLLQNGIGIHGISGIENLIASIRNHKGLQILNISDNTIKDNGMKLLANVLPEFENLEELYMDDCLLGKKGARIFSLIAEDRLNCPSLKTVSLLGNEIKSSEALHLINSIVEGKPALQKIDLRENEIKKSTINEIKEILSGFEKGDIFVEDEAKSGDEDFSEDEESMDDQSSEAEDSQSSDDSSNDGNEDRHGNEYGDDSVCNERVDKYDSAEEFSKISITKPTDIITSTSPNVLHETPASLPTTGSSDMMTTPIKGLFPMPTSGNTLFGSLFKTLNTSESTTGGIFTKTLAESNVFAKPSSKLFPMPSTTSNLFSAKGISSSITSEPSSVNAWSGLFSNYLAKPASTASSITPQSSGWFSGSVTSSSNIFKSTFGNSLAVTTSSSIFSNQTSGISWPFSLNSVSPSDLVTSPSSVANSTFEADPSIPAVNSLNNNTMILGSTTPTFSEGTLHDRSNKDINFGSNDSFLTVSTDFTNTSNTGKMSSFTFITPGTIPASSSPQNTSITAPTRLTQSSAPCSNIFSSSLLKTTISGPIQASGLSPKSTTTASSLFSTSSLFSVSSSSSMTSNHLFQSSGLFAVSSSASIITNSTPSIFKTPGLLSLSSSTTTTTSNIFQTSGLSPASSSSSSLSANSLNLFPKPGLFSSSPFQSSVSSSIFGGFPMKTTNDSQISTSDFARTNIFSSPTSQSSNIFAVTAPHIPVTTTDSIPFSFTDAARPTYSTENFKDAIRKCLKSESLMSIDRQVLKISKDFDIIDIDYGEFEQLAEEKPENGIRVGLILFEEENTFCLGISIIWHLLKSQRKGADSANAFLVEMNCIKCEEKGFVPLCEENTNLSANVLQSVVKLGQLPDMVTLTLVTVLRNFSDRTTFDSSKLLKKLESGITNLSI